MDIYVIIGHCIVSFVYFLFVSWLIDGILSESLIRISHAYVISHMINKQYANIMNHHIRFWTCYNIYCWLELSDI